MRYTNPRLLYCTLHTRDDSLMSSSTATNNQGAKRHHSTTKRIKRMKQFTSNSTQSHILGPVSAQSGTIWANMAYQYFFGRLETIPPLLSDDGRSGK